MKEIVETSYLYDTKLPNLTPGVLTILGWEIDPGFWDGLFPLTIELGIGLGAVELVSKPWPETKVKGCITWKAPRLLTTGEKVTLKKNWEKPGLRELDIRLAKAITALATAKGRMGEGRSNDGA